ncbi:MAG TPA: hypothetical protein VNO21_15915 [Polyangiaceae bacterium]|nr:hypothetical protein [Polyangiaceae bacterium]
MSPTLPLFAGEEPGPSVARARRPRGLVSLRQLARDLDANPRTLKRRLLRLHARLDGNLLVQLAKGGHYLVRLDVLRQHLPELVTPQLVDEDEETSELASAVGVASELRELRESIAQLSDEVRALRDIVVMR